MSAGGDSAGPDVDAALRFGVSPDHMLVNVSRYIPATGAGRPLSVELLRSALAAAGITARMDGQNAAEVVRLLYAGQDVSRIVLARGERPQLAQDAWIELACAPELPVLPGQVLGVLHPAVPAHPGRDIAGNPVPPADQRSPRLIGVAEGIRLGSDGKLTAQVPGRVRVTEQRIEILPQVRLSGDRMQATATFYPKDAQGAPSTAEGLLRLLDSQGVRFGLQMDAIAAGLAQALATKKPVQDVLVAQGLAPVNGQNGRLELLCAEQADERATDDNVRLDYHRRGLFHVAEPGQDIARLHRPTKGAPGRDVTGAAVPARDGAPLRLSVGGNVETLDNGELFRARIAGVLLTANNNLNVTELLNIPGDVDFGTGNIELAQGSVRVGGTVRTGFTVQAPGQIQVQGMVESARIIAGGDVSVRGGIFMSGDETAFVQAGGGVSAAFTHNAMIEAGGDVTVALSMVGSKSSKGSRVSCGGFLRVTDAKGRIMGGTVVSARGVEVFDAGSERGMVTTLALNHETPQIADLVKELRTLRELRQRGLFLVGEGDGALALSRLSAELRAEAENLLARRGSLEDRLKQIQRTLAELAQEHLERVASARIVVRGTAYQGVAIKMGGRSLYVERPLCCCVFSWDARSKEIVTGSL